jgi:uncharacterized damage-inducible protein DinB
MRQRELATLFDYMYWANQRILETAARLTNAQFTLPSVIAGRDLRATLVHTLDTEWSWRLRLQGHPDAEKALSVSDYRNVAALADHWKRDEAEMREWVATLDDETLARSIDPDRNDRHPLWFYLVHLVTHSHQHRSESAQLLTQLGRSPGDIDFLDYADWARGRSG